MNLRRITWRALMGLTLVALGAGSLFGWPAPTSEEAAFDQELGNLARRMDVTSEVNPTPASEERERDRFFAARRCGAWIEPRFEYSPIASGVREAVAGIGGRPVPAGFYHDLLDGKRNELLLKVALLEGRGTASFTPLSERLYSYPEPDLVLQAWRFLREGEKDLGPKIVSTASMAAFLRAALEEVGFDGWKVVIAEEMSAKAQVSPLSRIVKIKAGTAFSLVDGERLKHHELGVHARRAETGRQLPLGLFAGGLAGYLATEEGLAAYVETRQGIRTGLRQFALRVLAVHWAGTDPFSLVFRKLLWCGLSPEDAFALCQRVKRGLTDTGRPGGYTKDVSYLRGFLMVSRFAERGGSIDDLLRFGKAGLEDLPLLRDLEAR